MCVLDGGRLFFRYLEKLRFTVGRVKDCSTWVLSENHSKIPYPPVFFSCRVLCGVFDVGIGVGSIVVGTGFCMLNLSVLQMF